MLSLMKLHILGKSSTISVKFVFCFKYIFYRTGNLVTNANFEHFWLNEGFTVFVEQKIIGRLRGDEYRDFSALHGLSDLEVIFKIMSIKYNRKLNFILIKGYYQKSACYSARTD